MNNMKIYEGIPVEVFCLQATRQVHLFDLFMYSYIYIYIPFLDLTTYQYEQCFFPLEPVEEIV